MYHASILFSVSIAEGEKAYVALAEKSGPVWATLADRFLSSGFPAKALQASETGLLSFPGNPKIVVFKAKSLSALQRHDEALQLLEDFVQNHPSDSEEVFLGLAQLHGQRSKTNEALNALARALRLFPLSTGLLELKATILYDQRQFAKAIQVYRQLQRLNPKDPSAFALEGNALLELELYGSALDCYFRADRMAEGAKAWIIANIGNIMNRRGFHSLAVEYLERALALDRNSYYSQERLVQSRQNIDVEFQRLQTLLTATSADVLEESNEDPGTR